METLSSSSKRVTYVVSKVPATRAITITLICNIALFGMAGLGITERLFLRAPSLAGPYDYCLMGLCVGRVAGSAVGLYALAKLRRFASEQELSALNK
jgi:hypothetical protein